MRKSTGRGGADCKMFECGMIPYAATAATAPMRGDPFSV